LPSQFKAPSSCIRIFTKEGWHDLQPGLNGDSNPDWFGPEISFGPAMLKASPGRTVVLIKHAKGSCDLGRMWHPPDPHGNHAGPLYREFMDIVGQAVNSHASIMMSNIKGLIWMQGETDAWYEDPAMASAYEQNLTNLITSIRTELGISNLAFSIGRISTSWIWSGGGHGELVRQAQYHISQTVPCTVMVDTDDLPLNDDEAHYSSDGQIQLGERFADSLRGLWVCKSKPDIMGLPSKAKFQVKAMQSTTLKVAERRSNR
jgi:hypothetical protein